mmetsp:Transcript_19552/g.34860  ORF Transcript_19552/g.34860 Transcript_19552/m.34860 type:complete len:272 (-) Transcript_19552:109-924(-)
MDLLLFGLSCTLNLLLFWRRNGGHHCFVVVVCMMNIYFFFGYYWKSKLRLEYSRAFFRAVIFQHSIPESAKAVNITYLMHNKLQLSPLIFMVGSSQKLLEIIFVNSSIMIFINHVKCSLSSSEKFLFCKGTLLPLDEIISIHLKRSLRTLPGDFSRKLIFIVGKFALFVDKLHPMHTLPPIRCAIWCPTHIAIDSRSCLQCPRGNLFLDAFDSKSCGFREFFKSDFSFFLRYYSQTSCRLLDSIGIRLLRIIFIAGKHNLHCVYELLCALD